MLSRLFRQLARGPAAFRDFRAGKRAIESGEYASALACFERCIARYPSHADYVFHAAAVRNMMGDPRAAQRQCERALELDPNHPASHYLLAGLTLRGPVYTEILGALHERLAPRTYVEIGIAKGESLAKVRPATRVVGIDPNPRLAKPAGPNVQVFAMPSDEYFATRDVRADLGGLPIDLAFIDGAHVFEQALRDFINVERAATRASTILLHDTWPLTAFTAEREQRSGFWSGDVWRLVLILKKYRPDLGIANVGTAPTGLCVVRGLDPESRVLAENHDAIVAEFMAVDYSTLDADKAGLLNLFPNDLERVLEVVLSAPAIPA